MWNEICSKIFKETVKELENNGIRYFVLRNYKELPEKNTSKDVDIIIEPGKLKKARDILLKIYKNNRCTNYYEVIFGKVHCMHGINLNEKIAIHIDLIEGYVSKGYEIFTFEELYNHTYRYKGFYALDEYFEGVMLLIYKQFGYKKPILKDEYKNSIKNSYMNNKKEFYECLVNITNKQIANSISNNIENDNFDDIIKNSRLLTKQLRKYVFRRKPLKTAYGIIEFIWGKIWRIVFNYRKYSKSFAVIAPDGTGKTTFLEEIFTKLNFFFVNDESDGRIQYYHFRPSILPNLGEIGEKAKIMEQDKNFNNPHRSKPANPFSSLVRIIYYTIDYIIGWQKYVRRDVQYDKFSVFDRYSYDFIVDPLRTKLNLPQAIRKFFVAITPQPDIVFVLDADPEVIYARKQELTVEEISRQIIAYREISKSNTRFKRIDASQDPDVMSDKAIKCILDKFTEAI